ncbi:translesion DNA synthesis-associated protein ImuA [Rhodoferax sp.]|uniref:translesion DNA synthesis-associated protein ImuA n=1 Tax=Rhodoferax sp. TaxID=50421 RepID=UPI00374DE5A5
MPTSAVPFLDTVWRASELSAGAGPTVASGHALLDAALPGAGWPCGSLTEIMQTQAGVHEWRLLLPALRGLAGAVVLVASPHLPNMPALACLGLPLASVLLVNASRPADQLWAAEQALRCRDVSALMVWLPQARSEQLRRLHMAAQSANQNQAPLVFVFRPLLAQDTSSPAPLRLRMGSAPGHRLEIGILKRRGPTLDKPLLLLPALPAALVKPAKPASAPVPSFPTSPTPLYAVDRPRTPSTSA